MLEMMHKHTPANSPFGGRSRGTSPDGGEPIWKRLNQALDGCAFLSEGKHVLPYPLGDTHLFSHPFAPIPFTYSTLRFLVQNTWFPNNLGLSDQNTDNT